MSIKQKPTKKVHKQHSHKKTETSSLTEKPRDKWKILYFLILTVVAFGFYANSLKGDYVLDDGVVIIHNNFTLQGIKGIPEILSTDAFVGVYGEALKLTGGRYRPLSMVMFAIEYQLFGLNPFIGHLVNVLLFCITGIVIYILLDRLLKDRWPYVPFLAAFLFVIHPIHTEVVTNIKSRDEILCLLFSMLSLFYLLKRKTPYRLLMASLLFFLALLSKENAITFLAVIPLALYFFRKSTLKEIFLQTLPLFVVSILYIYLRYRFAGILGDRTTTDIMENPYLHATFPEKTATISFTLGKYFLLLLWPLRLSYDYSFNQVPVINWLDIKAILPGLILIALLIYSVYRYKSRSAVVFGILYFFITFSIVSNLFFNIGTSMGERFLYMPSLGFCLVISGLIPLFLKNTRSHSFPKPRVLLIPLVLLMAGTFYLVHQCNKAWKDNLTLYETDVKTVPNSARAHLYYGIELRNAFNTSHDTALLNREILEINRSAKIAPTFHHAFYNLGLAYLDQKQYDSAIRAFTKVLELQPYHILSQSGLAYAYLFGKRDQENGARCLEILIYRYHQTDPNYFDNLGTIYGRKKNYTRAIEIFEEGIEKNPRFAKLYLDAGITLDNLGNHEKAQQYYETAFRLDPGLRKK